MSYDYDFDCTCPGCEYQLDNDEEHRNVFGDYYNNCYILDKEVLKEENKYIEEETNQYNKDETNENIKLVMKYSNVTKESAILLMIVDVIQNVTKFIDKKKKPDIDYIKKLLEENNYEIMTCVKILDN